MATVGIINSAYSRFRAGPVEYDDWRLAGSGVNPPGVPVAAALTEIQTAQWCWQFANNAVMVFPDQQIPHDYSEGTDLPFHIHWAPTTSATYTGTWTMVITDWLNAGTGAARQAQTTMTAAFDSSLTAHQGQYAMFTPSLTGTNRKVSSLLTAHLSLSLSAGAACYLLGLDAHYQKDAIGSRQATSKD